MSSPSDHRHKRSKRFRLGFFWWTLLTLYAIALGIGVVRGVQELNRLLEDLPSVEALQHFTPELGSRLVTESGTPIAEYRSQNRYLVAYDALPDNMVKATLAIEDPEYFKHWGVRPTAILRALRANLQAGRTVQGGSTLTQQMVRNALDVVGATRTYNRKFTEALFALQVERELSKQEILEIYFNVVYLGNGATGIYAAAQTYFGKHPSQLTLSECASLAALYRRPNSYNPIDNHDVAIVQRDIVLEQMCRYGYISQEEAAAARQEDLVRGATHEQQVTRVDQEPAFAAYLRMYELLPKGPDGLTYAGTPALLSTDQLYKDGLTLVCALDLELQEMARQAVQNGVINLEQYRRKYPYGWGMPDPPRQPGRLEQGGIYDARIVSRQGDTLTFQIPHLGSRNHQLSFVPDQTWMDDFKVLEKDFYIRVQARQTAGGFSFDLVDDPHVEAALVGLQPSSGRVLAMIGGYDWRQEPDGRQLHRAKDLFQVGSAFKPFVYAAGMERPKNPYHPASIIRDERMTFPVGGGQVWTPKNYTDDYHGDVRYSEALQRSLNSATIALFQSLLDDLYTWDSSKRHWHFDFCERLGLIPAVPYERVLPVCLGTASLSPMQMAAAYGTFANGGILVEPYCLERINDRDRQAIWERPVNFKRVMSAESAFLITHMLEGTFRERHGTAHSRAADFPFPVAGKTGTTNDCTDSWFVGYSKNLVCAVWVGFDRRRSLGKSVTGASGALPIWKDFMLSAIPRVSGLKEGRLPDTGELNRTLAFDIPPGVVSAPISICAQTGQLAGPTCPIVKEYFARTNLPRQRCSVHAGDSLVVDPLQAAVQYDQLSEAPKLDLGTRY